MYVWSEIKYGDKVIKVGSEITQESLGCPDEEWEQLKEARVVRNTKYPDIPEGFTGSPREFVLEERKRQLAEVDDLDAFESRTDQEVIEEVVEEEQTQQEESQPPPQTEHWSQGVGPPLTFYHASVNGSFVSCCICASIYFWFSFHLRLFASRGQVLNAILWPS